MAKRFSERILEFLRRPEYQPMKAHRLAVAMGIGEAEQGDFHEAVAALRRVGRVVMGTGNAVMLPHPPSQVAGTFRGNPRGFGFVVPDGPTEHGDLYIAAGESLDAITGDKVLCRVLERGRRGGKPSFGGRVIKILERGDSRFVGALEREGPAWFVRPDGNTLHVPIMIGDPGAKGARAGDQVVVEIVRYPSEGRPAKGVIVDRLGRRGEAGVDVASIIRQYHLPTEFPEKALREVRAAARAFDPEGAVPDREDLRGRWIVTIDPDDAKDYDDAISLERLEGRGEGSGAAGRGRRGGRATGTAVWELGVHIADVSAFVREGGSLDTEARDRGTSVYLPQHVIPMLPEALSNGLCSLQEGEARLCKSAFLRYDAEGSVVGSRFANTVISSCRRLTYRQAQSIIDGEAGGERPETVQLLRRMDTLARAIQARRLREGMITLSLPEVELELDDDGRLVDARPEDTSFTHTIIEMFMVEANEAVARMLDRLGVPFIRRIHPEPGEDSLEAVGRFLRAAGHAVPRTLTPGDLQALLGALKGRPEAYAVNLAVLKSMSLAEYSPRAVGHFALASRCYTHFTSPIRRYADLTIHRLLDRRLRGELDGGGRRKGHEAVPDEEELAELGNHLSYVSRRAESAERELKTLKVLTLLSEQVGEEFDGVVTGLTNFGMYVQHPKYLVDGLLRLEDLGDDWWEVDLKSGRIVGERTRQSFMMGVILCVQIVEVDLGARQMRLSLVTRRARGGPERAEGRPGRPSPRRQGRPRTGEKAGRGTVGGRRERDQGRKSKRFRRRGRG
jgi:ribonuclease R